MIGLQFFGDSQILGFSRLLDKMENRDALVITKLGRGIMTMNIIINAVAQFERDRLVREKIESGETVSAIARQPNTSGQIMRAEVTLEPLSHYLVPFCWDEPFYS